MKFVHMLLGKMDRQSWVHFAKRKYPQIVRINYYGNRANVYILGKDDDLISWIEREGEKQSINYTIITIKDISENTLYMEFE